MGQLKITNQNGKQLIIDSGSLFKDIRKAITGKGIKVQISYIKY
jgi:hypothetical protein